MRTLFVTNLPADVDEAEIVSLFAQVGTVTDINLVRSRDTGRPRYAFVVMPNPTEAARALRDLDDLPWNHQRIVVRPAHEHQWPKTES